MTVSDFQDAAVSEVSFVPRILSPMRQQLLFSSNRLQIFLIPSNQKKKKTLFEYTTPNYPTELQEI